MHIGKTKAGLNNKKTVNEDKHPQKQQPFPLSLIFPMYSSIFILSLGVLGMTIHGLSGGLSNFLASTILINGHY